MTKLKITVTKEILEKSKMCKISGGDNCAIALAVRDIFPNAWVYPDEIEFDSASGIEIRLPDSARSYIELFDKTDKEQRPLLPEISFEIEIPDSVIDKINIDELKPLLQNHPTLEFV